MSADDGVKHRRLARMSVAALLVVGAAGACGGHSQPSAGPRVALPAPPAPAPAQQTAYPLKVDNCGLEETFTAAPTTVVTEGQALPTDILAQLGLGQAIAASYITPPATDDPTYYETILIAAGYKVSPDGSVVAANVPKGAFNLQQLQARHADLVVASDMKAFDPAAGLPSRAQLLAAGIRSIVPPDNCTVGNPAPTAEETDAYNKASVNDTYAFVRLLGSIFNKAGLANQLVLGEQQAISDVSNATAAAPTVRVAVLDPTSGPDKVTLYGGALVDQILGAAGAVNAIGAGRPRTVTMSPAQFQATKPQYVVVTVSNPQDLMGMSGEMVLEAVGNLPAAKGANTLLLYDMVEPALASGPDVRRLANEIHPQAMEAAAKKAAQSGGVVTTMVKTIKVKMTGKYRYDPAAITVPRGTEVFFQVTNDDSDMVHEFVIGSELLQRRHELQMDEQYNSMQGMGMDMSMGTGAKDSMVMPDDSHGIDVVPHETKFISWFAANPGTYIYGCHQPGHYAKGMHGMVTVTG